MALCYKFKRGDQVEVLAGRDKGKRGKVLLVDRKGERIVVEGANMVVRHVKPSASNPTGGIIKKEAKMHISNVMFLHKGKLTRVGFEVERQERGGKTVNVKYRVAKATGERID